MAKKFKKVRDDEDNFSPDEDEEIKDDFSLDDEDEEADIIEEDDEPLNLGSEEE